MKQVHQVEDIGISPWPVDLVEFGADAYAHRKHVSVKQLYNQVPQTAWVNWSSRQADSQFRTLRSWNENQQNEECMYTCMYVCMSNVWLHVFLGESEIHIKFIYLLMKPS